MTVINVTDATLKGDVTGPTFTGKVDGSQFSGSVTYTDTSTPPPETNTYGKITNFNAANDAYIKVDGVDCQIQNANKNWSIKNPDQYTLRFELHSKDCWSTSGWNDATQNNGAERTEMYWTPRYSHNTGQVLTNEFEFTLEPGPSNTAPWMVFSQTHGDPGQGSPPYELMMDGEKLKVVIGYKKPGQGSVTYKTVWNDANPIQRGHAYKFKVEIKFDLNSGFCKVWRDGTQIVNYAGPIGYDGDRYYWKQGIYRGPAPETISAKFSHTHITSNP